MSSATALVRTGEPPVSLERREDKPLANMAPMTFEQIVGMGDALVKTGFLPAAIKNGAQAAAIILTGQELGMPPMRALRSLNLVKGKVTENADSQLARFKSDGGRAQFKRLDDEAAVLWLRHPNGDEHTETFTIDDAQRAGLTGAGSMYEKYRRAMLRSRVITAGLKSIGWEGGAGNYDPQELAFATEDEPRTDSSRSSASGDDATAADATESEARCPKCGGEMYDNRVGKTNPRQPDFKCKNTKTCDGLYWPGQWPPRLATAEQLAEINTLLKTADLADAKKTEMQALMNGSLSESKADAAIKKLTKLQPPAGQEALDLAGTAAEPSPSGSGGNGTELAPGAIQDAFLPNEGEQRANPTSAATGRSPKAPDAPTTTKTDAEPLTAAQLTTQITRLLEHQDLHEDDRKNLKAKLREANTLDELRALVIRVQNAIDLPF